MNSCGGRFRRLTALAAVVVACAAVITAIHHGASDAAESEPERLNVVVILSDDQPLRSFELMPFLSSRRWTSFDNAVINNPLCCPSRATILTGLFSHRTGVETNNQGQRFDDSSTIATWLDDDGYRTGFFGKYLNKYPWDRGERWRPPGWDRWVGLERPSAYFDYQLNIDGRLQSRGHRDRDYLGRVVERQATRFIRASEQSPFLAFVSPYAPHDPTIPDPRDSNRKGLRYPLARNVNEEDVSDKPRWVRELKPVRLGYLRNQQRRYARASLSNDRIAKRLVGLLRKQGELDETVIIYLTDNGYSLGEHRHVGKTCGYEECIRTPMLIRYPGAPQLRISEPAVNADLAPTIADVANVRPPFETDGTTLLPLLLGEREQADRAILLRNVEHDPPRYPAPQMWGVRTREFTYLSNRGGERELYDLEQDPFELQNLAGRPAYADKQAELEALLHALRDEP